MKPKCITIGYLKNSRARFISNIVNTELTLRMLANFVRVKITNYRPGQKKSNLKNLKALRADYLLADIRDFNIQQFILREKGCIDLPFIIILRTVWGWLTPLFWVIPMLREEDIIIAPSEFARRSFLKISDRFNIHVIPHCLDVEGIQKKIILNPRKYTNTITYMGQISESKGVGTLIECLPEIIARVGDIRLNIIGSISGISRKASPKSYFVKEMEKRIIGMGLKPHVNFKGLKTGWNKYIALSESALFLNPTTYEYENFPVANLEAVSCGVPVITTNWAANNELIKDGDNGYLIDVDWDKDNVAHIDRKRLIDSAVNILQNKKLALGMRSKAREKALSYDFRKVMPKLVGLLGRKDVAKRGNADSGRWEILRSKKLVDFKHLYRREALFFLYYLGIAQKDFKSIWSKEELPGLADRKLAEKIHHEIFRHFCIQ